jgi:hypothetical protein
VTTYRVVVDEAWWGNFEFRAVNIAGGNDDTDLTGMEEEAASHFRIYIPSYKSLDWRYDDQGYWNSVNGGYATNPQTVNSSYYLASKRFTKADLPLGSIVEVDPGYGYRPEGWAAIGVGAPGRPDQVTTQRVVIDEAWWGNFEYRAFNVARSTFNVDLAGMERETASHFRIYVPTYQSIDWRYTGY